MRVKHLPNFCILATIFTVVVIAAASGDYGSTTPTTAPSTQRAGEMPLPDYTTPAQLSGHLHIGGSGTMQRFVTKLCDEYLLRQPNVNGKFDPRGSEFAPKGLANGECTVGMMSRRMSAQERGDTENRVGAKLNELIIAKDGILILTNAKNPIKGITLPQLDSIFGTDHLAGGGNVTKWADLGVVGDLASQNISPYGIKDEQHGTMLTFRKIVLLGGPANGKIGQIQYPEAEFGELVAKDSNGISYNVYHEPVKGARAIPVATEAGQPFVTAVPETIVDGTYPIQRNLYLYLIDGRDPIAADFARFVLSAQGQKIIKENWAVPVATKQGIEELKSLR